MRRVFGGISRAFEAEFFDAVLQRAEGHAEQLRGAGDIPVGPVERLDDLSFLMGFPRFLLNDGL